MKNWFSKHKIRLLISLVMIAVGIVLVVCLDGSFTGPESLMWQRMVFIFLAFGTILSGLFGGIFGIWGYAGAYIFLLIVVLPQALPEPFNRYYAVIYIAAIFCLPYLRLRKKKADGKGKAGGGNAVKTSSSEKKTPKKAEKDSSVESILVNNMYSGRWYQLQRRGGFVYAYFVGGEIKGPRFELLQMAKDNPRTPGKKDICFAVEDIVSVRVKDISNGIYSRVATVKVGNKKYRFWEIGNADRRFLDFFQSLSKEDVLNKESRANLTEAMPNEKRMELARKIKYGVAAYVLVVTLPWLFLKVPYELFAVLNLFSLPIILVMYRVFANEITMCEEKSSSKKHSIAILTVVSGFGLALRSLMDFNIINWGRLFIWAAAIFFIFLAAFFFFTKEWRAKKSAIGIIVLALLAYSFGATAEINYVFHKSEAVKEEAVISEMHISTSSKSPDRYMIDVIKSDGGEQELQISKSDYEALSVGDTVEVNTYTGALGIRYSEAE